jgi:hypothetical protein
VAEELLDVIDGARGSSGGGAPPEEPSVAPPPPPPLPLPALLQSRLPLELQRLLDRMQRRLDGEEGAGAALDSLSLGGASPRSFVGSAGSGGGAAAAMRFGKVRRGFPSAEAAHAAVPSSMAFRFVRTTWHPRRAQYQAQQTATPRK